MELNAEDTAFGVSPERAGSVAAARIPPVVRVMPWLALLRVAAVTALALLLAAAVRWTLPERRHLPVTVDGHAETITTFRPTVGALLVDLGIQLRPEDRLQPPAETPLTADTRVAIVRAHPFILEADGRDLQLYSHAETVGALLAEAAVHLKPGDVVRMDGEEVTLETRLDLGESGAPPGAVTAALPLRAWETELPAPARLSIERSVPIAVDDGSVPFTIHTTAPTIGEALHEAGVTLYLGDHVQPALGTPARPGQRVYIARSKSVVVNADGHRLRTRTRGKNVGDALVDLGLYVTGSDRVTPPISSQLSDQIEIAITRVRESVLVEREVIPFESIMVPDDNLELDTQRLAQQGQDGEFRRRSQIVTEDGVEISRQVTDAWVAADPVTRMTAYGRKLVSRPLDTPEGPVSYWRKMSMYATSYSPARSGTPKSAPWYGRTRLGLTLRKGIVAVDTSVIPLRSRVYIPGYGIAIAGDTGGGVRGKWIDLGFEDHNYESWHRWVDVYVLDPPPAARQIRWVLPNYPPPGFPRRR